MTKRAGKRKNRMGNQKHPPGKIQGPDTIEGEDNLSKSESLRLELMAASQGWLAGSQHDEKRRKLIQKLLDRGIELIDKEEDLESWEAATRIAKVISSTELGAVKAAAAITRDKSRVVVVQQNNNANQSDTLTAFVDSLSPEQQQDWLNRYGVNAARAANILEANSRPVGIESNATESGAG